MSTIEVKKPQVKVARCTGVSLGHTRSNPMNILKPVERRSTRAMRSEPTLKIKESSASHNSVKNSRDKCFLAAFPQDRQDAQHRHASNATRPRGRGDRVTRREFIKFDGRGHRHVA